MTGWMALTERVRKGRDKAAKDGFQSVLADVRDGISDRNYGNGGSWPEAAEARRTKRCPLCGASTAEALRAAEEKGIVANPSADPVESGQVVDTGSDTAAGPVDADGDGFSADEDCDDSDAAVNPDAEESCNGVDDDCDGAVDEAGAPGESTWYVDGDGDGFGDPQRPVAGCEQPDSAVSDDTDCADDDPFVYPTAEDTCDGVDSDCDGVTDEDALEGLSLFNNQDGSNVAYVHMTPNILAGILYTIMFIVVTQIGIGCMGSIQGQGDIYVKKMPTIGREA